MKASIIQNIVGFLERVQLTGKEVPAYNETMQALGQEYQLATAPPPAIPAAPEGIAPKHPAELAAE